MKVNLTPLEILKKYFNKHKEEIQNDFVTFLRFKSISTEKEHLCDINSCILWLKHQIESIGFTTKLWETIGHPTLFAENCEAGVDKPTILIYNHYDVQPVDPLDLWKNPPFEPFLEGQTVYARGAQDNKGQCMYVFQALKALSILKNTFPINIKWIIEGEEEAGSKGLAALLPTKKKELKSDYLAVVDLGIPKADVPSITLGVRGLVTMDIQAFGSNTDLHSGTHGGRAYNPNHALVEILAKLRDQQGKICIPGFYDDVLELTENEKEKLSFEFDESAYFDTFALKSTGGELNYSPLERSTIRPTIEINGIIGGYTGDGFKTVIPACASAKLSCRLVPNQDPEKIGNLVANYLQSLAPEGIKIKVNVHSGKGIAVRANPDSEIVKAFSEAYSDVFDKKCSYTFEGGSIPIIAKLMEACGGEVIMMGMGLDSDQIHAPNEHFDMNRFEKGFLVMSRGLELLGK